MDQQTRCAGCDVRLTDKNIGKGRRCKDCLAAYHAEWYAKSKENIEFRECIRCRRERRMYTVDSDHCLTCRRELDRAQKMRTCIHCDKTGCAEEFTSPNVCGECDAKRRVEWKERRKGTSRDITCRVCKRKSRQQTYRGHICSMCHNNKCAADYSANKARVKARSKRSLSKSRARNKTYIDTIRTETPCRDCGRFFPPEGMDFDHLPGFEKKTEVSVMAQQGWSLNNLKEEIAKCEVVCAVCHRVRTSRRWARKSQPAP